MFTYKTKQEIIWRYFNTEEDISDLAERFGMPFKETLKLLKPYIGEEAVIRRGLLQG